ncbi:MAG: flavin reductase family protein [Bacilli bacterium]|nr:flavin reductase family protein [Bacilli bacterium]
MKRIEPKDITSYKDPFRLFAEGALTVVESDGEIDPMTIGWGGLGILWSKMVATVYIHATRYSKILFDKADRFAICFFDDSEESKKALQYCGSVSLRDEDKVKGSGLTLTHIDGAPAFMEASLVIVCDKIGQSDFDPTKVEVSRIKAWYGKDGPHTIYQGEIKAVYVK